MQETKKLGNYIRKLREDKNLSLNSFSYKNGLEPSTLSRIETGIIDPKYSTLVKIAAGLDIKVSELLKNFEKSN
jgi:transcriptional regulator with XRE-family HTH domain